MAEIKANHRGTKITTAIVGVAILGLVSAWGGYRIINWWNAPVPPSQLSASVPNSPVSPAAPDSPDTDALPNSQMADAARSVHLASVPASHGSANGELAKPVAGTSAAPSLANAPATVAGAGGSALSAALTPNDIAMHPSLKYHRQVISTGDNSSSRQSAAMSLPVVTFGNHFASVSKGAPATQETSEVPVNAMQATIDADLKLEDDRKFVMSMCRDLSGRLWVGTEDGGVQCFDPSAPELHQWTQFTTKDGLGDDNGYAIACDRLGRIWVGHLNHGVSVYNGQKWQCYEVVGGISRPDTLSGPLGERVFAIKVCPSDGDVWISTNSGLSRYSESKGTWIYYTRADGLPSDQIQAIAFDHQGNAYVGTQCDGIAIAQSADGYRHWQTVTGPENLPTQPSGSGLPTNLINDVVVTRDGIVVAATTAGLSWSKDKCLTWQYVRGREWGDKVRGLCGGPPKDWQPADGAWLAEDYVTCLAEGDNGLLWIGYRQRGLQLVDLQRSCVVEDVFSDKNATCITAGESRAAVVGAYGDGSSLLESGNKVVSLAPTQLEPALPQGARAPTIKELDEITSHISSDSTSVGGAPAFYLGEDWTTEGDWVGRYGRQFGMLCGAGSPLDHSISFGLYYKVKGQLGLNAAKDDLLRHWIGLLNTQEQRSLWDPCVGHRRQAEWDDHGEAYSAQRDGPDIWVDIEIPAGIHTISLYFVNGDEHQTYGSDCRDYIIDLLRLASDNSQFAAPLSLAHCRVRDFFSGVYKTFRVCGPGRYRFRISRNHSYNTICSGVFVDKETGVPTAQDTMALPWMSDILYEAPRLDDMDDAPASSQAWYVIDAMLQSSKITNAEHSSRIVSYRALWSEKTNEAMLNNWRWRLHIWSPSDRTRYIRVMADAWSSMVTQNPKLLYHPER